MTYTEEYREHIEYTFNAYYKIVIYHTAINPARQQHKKCEKDVSLEYLTEGKHYPFSTLDERKVCTIDDRIPKTTGRLYAGIKYIA